MTVSELELLREQWCAVATRLGIEFVAPISLPLPDGTQWEFAALLPQFGGENGTLIAAGHHAAAFAVATAAGYGVSSMRAEHHHLPVDPEDYVKCLNDWGWVGQAAAPEWYTGAA